MPNLIPKNAPWLQNQFWARAQIKEGIEFWDMIKRQGGSFLEGDKPFWKKTADEEYARFLQLRSGVPPEVVLEVGGGSIPRIFYMPVKTRIALDPTMDHQRRLFPEVYEGIACLQAIAENTPLRDGCIDFILLGNCWDHFSDPKQGLRELMRTLRPDGLIFVALETFTRFWKMWHKVRDKTHEYRWTPPEIHQIVAECGGEVVQFEIDPPVIREYYAAVLTSPRHRLALALKKIQTCWFFVQRPQPVAPPRPQRPLEGIRPPPER
jgi:SAM-dependent methyltransferase